MDLSFSHQKMLLANVNVRSEVHGEEREPAADLKFECDVSNDVLSELHPALKALLYHFDASRDADLADRGKKAESGFLPHLRFQALGAPLKWEGEMAGALVSVGVAGTKRSIELSPVKVNGVAFEPLDGGVVRLSFRVQCHPSERDFGALATLAQAEVEVTLAGGDSA